MGDSPVTHVTLVSVNFGVTKTMQTNGAAILCVTGESPKFFTYLSTVVILGSLATCKSLTLTVILGIQALSFTHQDPTLLLFTCRFSCI